MSPVTVNDTKARGLPTRRRAARAGYLSAHAKACALRRGERALYGGGRCGVTPFRRAHALACADTGSIRGFEGQRHAVDAVPGVRWGAGRPRRRDPGARRIGCSALRCGSSRERDRPWSQLPLREGQRSWASRCRFRTSDPQQRASERTRRSERSLRGAPPGAHTTPASRCRGRATRRTAEA